jgi:hypothetical protein
MVWILRVRRPLVNPDSGVLLGESFGWDVILKGFSSLLHTRNFGRTLSRTGIV